MNTLTLYLYLMDVLSNLQGLFAAITIFGGIASVIAMVIYTIEKERFPKFGYFLIPLWFFFAISATLIPSKSTMQLMAVSEAGEMVVTNPEVRDVLNDVKEVFKKQLDDMKKD